MQLPRRFAIVVVIVAGCSARAAPTDALRPDAPGTYDGDRRERSSADIQPPCPPVAATPGEIAATPRSDTNLELLALRLSDAVTARQDIYDRIVGDVGAIRKQRPEVMDIQYRALHDGRTLSFSVDAATAEAMRDGKYHAWDCLNSAYQVTGLEAYISQYLPPSLPYHSVLLTLKGTYYLEKLKNEYAATLPKGSVDPKFPVGDGSTICVTRSNELWHYVMSRSDGDCPVGCTHHTAYYFTTTPGSPATFHATWDSDAGVPYPTWWLTYGPPNGKAAACPRSPYE